MITLWALECLVVALIVMLLWQQTKITVRSFFTWEELLSALEPVAMANIAHLALEYSNPAFFPLRTKLDQRWEMVGGVQGLRKLRSNAELLAALALCAERWVPHDRRSAVVVLRNDAVALRSLATKLLILSMLRPFWPQGTTGVAKLATLYFRQIQGLSGLFRHGPSGYQQVFEVVVWHSV